MSDYRSIEASERIIVALDCGANDALALAEQLRGRARWLKVGMTLYYREGPSIVEALKKLGYKIFLDLKFHDIPHQVAGAAEAAVRSGADMLTMHCSGGVAMMEAAQRSLVTTAAELGRDLPISLGVTVLTSLDQEALARIGIDRPVADQVVQLADLAHQAGLSGVVSSPQEASRLRALLGDEAVIVTPGIRPATSEVGDQKRVSTPQSAVEAGASYLVIGRPISQANDPLKAFDDIVKELHAN